MILFTKLFLAHIIGDFLLQPKRWVIQKEAKKAGFRIFISSYLNSFFGHYLIAMEYGLLENSVDYCSLSLSY